MLISCDKEGYPINFNRADWVEIKTELIWARNCGCTEINDTGYCIDPPAHVYEAGQFEKRFCKKLASEIEWQKNDVFYGGFSINLYEQFSSCTPHLWVNFREKRYWIQLFVSSRKTDRMSHSTCYMYKFITGKIPKDFKPI